MYSDNKSDLSVNFFTITPKKRNSVVLIVVRVRLISEFEINCSINILPSFSLTKVIAKCCKMLARRICGIKGTYLI